MKTKKAFSSSILCGLSVLSLVLCGCSNVKENLGLEKEAPDEFAVIRRAPLEIPEQLVLPPPRPGMPRPQENAPVQEAKAAIFGSGQNATTEKSAAENAILQKTGSNQTASDIRAAVDTDAERLKDANKPVAQKLLGIVGQGGEEPSASVVNAEEEAERIQKNIKEGKPVTEGETPTVEE